MGEERLTTFMSFDRPHYESEGEDDPLLYKEDSTFSEDEVEVMYNLHRLFDVK